MLVNDLPTLRESICQFLNLELVETPVDYKVQEVTSHAGYRVERIICDAADGDPIPAFLMMPNRDGVFPAVMVHHQHAGQRHLGKSEVIGLAGDPLQAFGPALAARGFVVLAPDSTCFEDRRKHASGIEPQDGDDLQHFIEMGSRLVQGDTLMRKVLSDASAGLSLLAHHPQVDNTKIGVCGHSYGGNTALFQMAMEPRLAFGVSSGALCSYAYKHEHDIALEMALIIPGFAAQWDLHHLLACIAPRPLLVVSAKADKFSQDADEVISRAQPNDHIQHDRFSGGHALTQERFDAIVAFLCNCVA